MSKDAQSLYVVGLGNPGERYRGTRHNAGFEFLDLLSNEFGSNWSEVKRDKYIISSCSLSFGRVLRMVKPISFMNLSGEPLLAAIKFYKDMNLSSEPMNLLVAHDELDFKSGNLKLKVGGGAGGHRGIQSIINILGSREFFRFRIGIGHPRDLVDSDERFVEVSDWVLSKSKKDDAIKEKEVLSRVARKLYQELTTEVPRMEFGKILERSIQA